MRIALAETFDALSSERDRLSAIFTSLDEAVIVVDPDGEVRFANPAVGRADRRGRHRHRRARPWLRRATHRGSAGSGPRRDRRARLRDRGPLAAGRDVGAARRPRPHRRAPPRAGRARVRLQRRPRAAQPDRRHVGRDRGPALGRQGRSRGPRALPRPARERRRPGQPADEGAADPGPDGGGRRGRGRHVASTSRSRRRSRRSTAAPTGVELETEVSRTRRQRRPRPAPPGADRPAHERVQAHSRRPASLRFARAWRTTEWSIEVEDTGTGIRADEMDRVFDRFYRGCGSLEQEGFGLGLAIAKRMVDVMGGELSGRLRGGPGQYLHGRPASR